MNSLFNPSVTDYFLAYSSSHLVVLAILVILAALIFAFKSNITTHDGIQRTIKYTLLSALIVPETILYGWYSEEGLWDIQYTLPLELCSISQILAIVMLISRSQLLYQIVFFAGIGGALQAMLTPDLEYPFPHFRFFHFFIVHIAIILAPLYMTWVEKYRPTWKSIGIAMIFLNILVVTVGGIDYWLKANYMFLRHKPESASLLDVLGPYPYYLVVEEGIAVCIFTIMYLPFLWRNKIVE
jgi:hypothetical integral membrane protein (TIGR02206 family)